MNTIEIIEWMMKNRIGLKKTAKNFNIPITTLRGRIDRVLKTNFDLSIKYTEHVESMRTCKTETKKDNLIAMYFMQQDKITSRDILNYSLKVNSETPVARIVELLESNGRNVIRV